MNSPKANKTISEKLNPVEIMQLFETMTSESLPEYGEVTHKLVMHGGIPHRHIYIREESTLLNLKQATTGL